MTLSMKSLSRRGRATTLEEVAAAAGVSRATASRVFNGNSRVSAATRRAVERAAERLGYAPNQAARSLVTGRTDSVALVIPEPAFRLSSDPFFRVLVRGIGDVLAQHDLQLVQLLPQSASEEERVGRYLARGHVDGALLASLRGPNILLDKLLARGVPLVVGGRPHSEKGVTYVSPDNVEGARLAATHLAANGRRRIATITGPLDRTSGMDRLAGYRLALEAAGLPCERRLEEEADYTSDDGEAAMRRLLARSPDLDAVFCASDLIAVGALRTLAAAGRSVPGDVAVVGFDDSPVATTTTPPLTSVHQPVEEMGREMARLLLAAIADPGAVGRRIILATELAVRESSQGGGNHHRSTEGQAMMSVE